MPGIRVPQALLDEMEAAGPDGEVAEGIEIAARIIREVRKLCAGVHIMAIGWESADSRHPAGERPVAASVHCDGASGREISSSGAACAGSRIAAAVASARVV